MNYKYAILIYIFLSILYTQENIPFDVSKQFAVPIENNQLLWNDDKSFNKLLIDRSSRNFKNKFTNLDFEELPEDSSYVKSKFIYEFGDYGFDKLSIGLKKHSKDEEFQFEGSKKSVPIDAKKLSSKRKLSSSTSMVFQGLSANPLSSEISPLTK